MCVMCQIRSTLKKAMDEIDALPEVNSPLYDDMVAEAYQAIESAYHTHEHYCDESAQQSVQLTAFGVGMRARFANWLRSLANIIVPVGGN